MNAAEAKTLAKITKAGAVGALLASLDMRHVIRLGRRGLIRSLDTSNTSEIGARVVRA